jgi:glycosyltransferase involved in cell wall biosynthesis
MKVLHICSDFAKQAIYSKLIAELSTVGLKQIVFAPVRSTQEAAQASILERTAGARVLLPKVLTPLDRICFRRKIRRVLQVLEEHVETKQVNLVHAHFWYSDGGAALQLNERLGIPYVVAVRNTDVNVFLKLRPDLFGIARRVLSKAQRIIFITPSYVDRVLNKLDKELRLQVAQKISVVPNGISADWLQSSPDFARERHYDGSGILRILYVGEFSVNKNIRNLVAAVDILNRYRPTSLTLVGSGGADENWVRRCIPSRGGRINWIGRISDPIKLQHVFREHDVFAMPSLQETFGVVYLEALSQGLPILHTKGEGVDGYFKGINVAEAVNPKKPYEIAEKLQILAARHPGIGFQCRAVAEKFDWKLIAQEYLNIYHKTSRGSTNRG